MLMQWNKVMELKTMLIPNQKLSIQIFVGHVFVNQYPLSIISKKPHKIAMLKFSYALYFVHELNYSFLEFSDRRFTVISSFSTLKNNIQNLQISFIELGQCFFALIFSIYHQMIFFLTCTDIFHHLSINILLSMIDKKSR